MSRSRWIIVAVTLVVLAAGGARALAGGAAVREAGEYAIHYNAMPADHLDAELAERYGLPHSSDRCVITVAVVDRSSGQAQPAMRIMASATWPDGRMQHVDMRQVKDDGGVYYVGDVPIGAGGTLSFKVDVRPGSSATPQTIRFSRSFGRP